MSDKAIEPGKKSTERYLPKAAWAAMSKAERKKTDDKRKEEVVKVNSLLRIQRKLEKQERWQAKKLLGV